MSWHTESAWVSHAPASAPKTIAIHLGMGAASERNMHAPGEDVNGTAVAVEGRVQDRLVVRPKGNLARERQPVIDLAQHLGTVPERAVSDDEPIPPRGQVEAVEIGEPAHHEPHACLVLGPAPPGAGLHDPESGGAVDLGEGPGLVRTVVVAHAYEG